MFGLQKYKPQELGPSKKKPNEPKSYSSKPTSSAKNPGTGFKWKTSYENEKPKKSFAQNQISKEAKERAKIAAAQLKLEREREKARIKIGREELKRDVAEAKYERRTSQSKATKARYEKIGTKLTPLQGIFGGSGKKKTTKKKAKRGKIRW